MPDCPHEIGPRGVVSTIVLPRLPTPARDDSMRSIGSAKMTAAMRLFRSLP